MSDNNSKGFSHARVETSNFLMIVLILIAVAFGGLVEIVPCSSKNPPLSPSPV